MPPTRIAVLLHGQDERFESDGYLLPLLMTAWTQRGRHVEVVRGVAHAPEADLIIPHLDLTVTPAEYQQFLARYSVALNARVVDISKSAISANLLRRGDHYAGEVIVKTNRNFGGLPERRLRSARPQSIWQRAWGKAMKLVRPPGDGPEPWRSIECMKSTAYPVFASLRDVPAGVFRNPNLVVEKFLPEIDGDDYCLRYSYFLGDRSTHFLLRSKEKVVKGSNSFRCEEVEAPAEIEAMRQRMGFDYGKFDYVMREGKVVLFDVNRTPACAALHQFQLADRVAAHLAEGIDSLIGERAVNR